MKPNKDAILIVYRSQPSDAQLDFFRLRFKGSERHYIAAEELISANTTCNSSLDIKFEQPLNNSYQLVSPPEKNTHHYRQCFAIDDSEVFDLSLWQPALGLIKNLYCERILLVFLDTNANRINEKLRGLGFFIESPYPILEKKYQCLSYNLSSYNRKRDWNNARFWANPENFNRFRW